MTTPWTTTIAATMLLALPGAAAAAEEPPPSTDRMLVVMAAGKPDAQGALKPMIDELCAKARAGALSSRYTHVVKVGLPIDVVGALRGLPPDQEKEAATGVLNLVITVLGAGAATTCTGQDAPFQNKGGGAFDVLILDLIHTSGERGNVAVAKITSQVTVDKTQVELDVDAMGVPLLSPTEMRGFVACVAWTAWQIPRWPAPAANCSRMNLADPPRPTSRDGVITWGKRLMIGGGGVALAAGALWLVSNAKYNSLTDRCSLAHPCTMQEAQSGRDSVRTWEGVSWTVGVIGVTTAVVGSTLYLLAGKREAGAQAALQPSLVLFPQGGAGLSARGRF